VARDIEVQQPSGAVVHHYKDVDQAEGRSDGHEEVASDDGLSVIAQERGPTLIAAGLSRDRLGHVLANGAGRNTNSELQQQLVGDPFLTPGRFSGAMRRISRRKSAGIIGRPGLDLSRQNKRQPARCQRSTVCGRTTVRHDLQLHSRVHMARLRRVAASIRRGWTPRSWKSAICRRRIRVSATIAWRG
jgi:hypothetical protein